MSRHQRQPLKSRGMVLVAVLWIVAALSLIVTGMVHSVRAEIKQVSMSSQLVQGAAWGGGAIAIVLQRLVGSGTFPAGIFRTEVKFQERAIEVEVRPLTGYIDLNLAQLPLLERLFTFGAHLPEAQARTLAQQVIDQRNRADSRGRPMRFEAIEDLLQMEGMSYEIYAQVAELITVDARGSGRVNILAAPLPVLEVLAEGNQALAARIASTREPSGTGVDATGLTLDLVDNAPSRRCLIQARVPLADGSGLLTSRWVDLAGGQQEGLPWRVFHADSRIVAVVSAP